MRLFSATEPPVVGSALEAGEVVAATASDVSLEPVPLPAPVVVVVVGHGLDAATVIELVELDEVVDEVLEVLLEGVDVDVVDVLAVVQSSDVDVELSVVVLVELLVEVLVSPVVVVPPAVVVVVLPDPAVVVVVPVVLAAVGAHVKPLGSWPVPVPTATAVNVTWAFQKSVTVPEGLVHRIPVSHT